MLFSKNFWHLESILFLFLTGTFPGESSQGYLNANVKPANKVNIFTWDENEECAPCSHLFPLFRSHAYSFSLSHVLHFINTARFLFLFTCKNNLWTSLSANVRSHHTGANILGEKKQIFHTADALFIF